jgi:hypothetical protein
MPKILITGNGFDLFHNLPTKYQHFMSIMKTIETNDFTGDVSFEVLFGNNFKDDSPNDYTGIADNYDVQKLFFESSKLNEIRELLKSNLWYKYFKTVVEIDSWIDFEMEIEVILNQLSIFKKLSNKKHIFKNYFLEDSIIYTSLELFDIISIINRGGAFKFKEKYINKSKISIDIKMILSNLSQSFEEFIVIFNRYLVDIVESFYEVLAVKLDIPFHLMNEIYTFNYMPSLERIYGVDNSKITYLHGKISDDNEVQNMVLGVSEISDDLKVEKAYDFTKYYQKIRKKSNNKFIEIPPKNHNYDEMTIFYIIGHSLNKSDDNYVLSMFDFLKRDKYGKCQVCVFYYDTRDRDSKIRNLLHVIGEELITKMHQDKRLYFVELSNINIKKELTVTLQRSGGWG